MKDFSLSERSVTEVFVLDAIFEEYKQSLSESLKKRVYQRAAFLAVTR